MNPGNLTSASLLSAMILPPIKPKGKEPAVPGKEVGAQGDSSLNIQLALRKEPRKWNSGNFAKKNGIELNHMGQWVAHGESPWDRYVALTLGSFFSSLCRLDCLYTEWPPTFCLFSSLNLWIFCSCQCALPSSSPCGSQATFILM